MEASEAGLIRRAGEAAALTAISGGQRGERSVDHRVDMVGALVRFYMPEDNAPGGHAGDAKIQIVRDRIGGMSVILDQDRG